MTNKEFYKNEILELACSGKAIAVDNRSNEPCECSVTWCGNCKFLNAGKTCHDLLSEWSNKEYTPFEKDELVEVSQDGKDWCLRHFSHIDKEGRYGHFRTFDWGCTSEESGTTSSWKYCQKYGTLGA